MTAALYVTTKRTYPESDTERWENFADFFAEDRPRPARYAPRHRMLNEPGERDMFSVGVSVLLTLVLGGYASVVLHLTGLRWTTYMPPAVALWLAGTFLTMAIYGLGVRPRSQSSTA